MPASIRRASHGAIGSDAELLAGRDDRVPEVGSARPVEQVHLEARYRGPARAGDQHGDAVDLEALAPVVLDVVDRWSHELLEGLRRQRPLHLDGVDVRVAHLGVQAALRGDAECVQPCIGVRELHPPDVRFGVQEHGVVHDAPVGRGHEHVLALLHRARREITTGQHVDQAVRVGAADLDRAFHTDVPQGDALVQEAVLGLRDRRSTRAGTCGCRCRTPCSRRGAST